MRAAASALALLALTVPGVTAAGSANATNIRVCAATQLKIRLGRSFVAAGNVGGDIRFANRGSAQCRLRGWPSLAGITAAGTSTSARRVRSTMFGPYVDGVPLVRLRPGQAAVAVFAGGDHPGPGQTRCPPPYRRLRVSPPGSSRSVVLSAWLPALDAYLPTCSPIGVTMVVRASDLNRG